METMTTEQKILFVNQIEFCYGNIEWTHKIHEKCGNTWETMLMIDNEDFCPICGSKTKVYEEID